MNHALIVAYHDPRGPDFSVHPQSDRAETAQL
jgi:hypothetical protein